MLFNKITPLEFEIDEILRLFTTNSFFISDWNKSEDEISFPNKLLNPCKENIDKNKNKYIFSDELQEIKSYFTSNVHKVFHEVIDEEKFCIMNNGTSGLFLTFLALKNKNNNNILVFNPSYFTYINVFNNIGLNYHFLNTDIYSSCLQIDSDMLKNFIIDKKINIVIITDPLFGIGISIAEITYETIVALCNELNIWLVVDYLYGGMVWDTSNHIVNSFLFDLQRKNDKMIVVESISKRLFLNGIKNCLVYANKDIINDIENLSVSFIGSISCIQIDIFKEIYSIQNLLEINNLISENIKKIKQCYELLKTLIMGTDLYISDSNSSYFTLLGIPYSKLKNLNGVKAAQHIAIKTDIITIPHERYGYILEGFYTFRVNLTSKKDLLFLNINKLLNVNFN
ncbi:MAG: aminotransferase class I/II-fold pyridoxal phosphate-dependent enzyme [Candidatus Cloacimonetes bacterium]|nr:aminotransferase class I/II-fold pyridoxal phosphate-dependent enzyme [Candidatus Cloacimonadota bacterium]